MADRSHEPKNNKDLLEFLYLKHGLTVKDNDTSIRAEKYDRLVTEYNTKVNGNFLLTICFFMQRTMIKQMTH